MGDYDNHEHFDNNGYLKTDYTTWREHDAWMQVYKGMDEANDFLNLSNLIQKINQEVIKAGYGYLTCDEKCNVGYVDTHIRHEKIKWCVYLMGDYDGEMYIYVAEGNKKIKGMLDRIFVNDREAASNHIDIYQRFYNISRIEFEHSGMSLFEDRPYNLQELKGIIDRVIEANKPPKRKTLLGRIIDYWKNPNNPI